MAEPDPVIKLQDLEQTHDETAPLLLAWVHIIPSSTFKTINVTQGTHLESSRPACTGKRGQSLRITIVGGLGIYGHHQNAHPYVQVRYPYGGYKLLEVSSSNSKPSPLHRNTPRLQPGLPPGAQDPTSYINDECHGTGWLRIIQYPLQVIGTSRVRVSAAYSTK